MQNLSIKRAIESGIPTVAECGGFIYLTKSIKTNDEKLYPMIGVIDGEVEMQEKLAALGYREVLGRRTGTFCYVKVKRQKDMSFIIPNITD